MVKCYSNHQLMKYHDDVRVFFSIRNMYSQISTVTQWYDELNRFL